MKLFTTAPPSVRFHPHLYLKAVADIAQWHEAAGIDGMLIYTDNSLIDPWTVAQAALERTQSFVPLVATQPLYLHPYAAARKVSSLAFLYGRKIALNMVAGGFMRDLVQLGDHTEHNLRYDRLIEYTSIVMALLRGESVTFNSPYYQIDGLKLQPALDPSLLPDLYVSGASDSCITAAATLGATRLSYTKPVDHIDQSSRSPGPIGLRFGVIARQTRDEAWQVAGERFPADRRGQMAHRMAQGATDSIWHQQISEVAERLDDARAGVYWLFPLKNYKTFCPYLVGDYDEVADYLRGYLALGYGTLILDVPTDQADLAHTMQAINQLR